MSHLDRIPRNFLLGLSLALLISTLGLVIHITVVRSGGGRGGGGRGRHGGRDGGGGGGGGGDGSFRPLPDPHERFSPYKSHLGIYSEAAVASDAEPCAKIGADVLRRNGNAVDAAVAALFCNGVVHPFSMGLGGGFVMTLYLAKEDRAVTLIARETAPAVADRDFFAGVDEEATRRGPMAVAVPGELLGYHEAKLKYGNPSVSWASLVQPSIDLCEGGVPVTRSLPKALKAAEKYVRRSEYLSRVFVDPATDEFVVEGDTFKMPKLATTLRRIAENGAGEIYGPEPGKTGVLLAEDLAKMGSNITKEDIAGYKVKWEDAVTVDLGSNLTLFTTPPPTSGPVLAGIVAIMANFGLGKEDADRPVTYHRFVEACKYGFAERTKLGDWNGLTTEDSEIRKTAALVTSADWAREKRHLIRDDCTVNNASYYGGVYADVPVDHGTAHTSVLAPNGDAVAVTSTINMYFGAGVASASTGIILNNEMDDFSTPGHVNAYGIRPSEANFIAAGKRPLSSMVPTVVVDRSAPGKPRVRLAVGASGGPKILTSTAFVSTQHLWLGRNVKESVDEPRLHHQLLPMSVTHDRDAAAAVLEYLRKAGHELRELPASQRGSVVQAVATEGRDLSVVTANHDWRKAGGVDGF